MSALVRIPDSGRTSREVRKVPRRDVQTQRGALRASSDGILPSEGTSPYSLVSALLQSFSDSHLHWRIIIVSPIKLERFGWMEWWLRHKTRH
jgi:hypothetical protein